MTLFSSLNVVAARLARRGNAPAAERVALAAANLESGPEFAALRRLLADLPDQAAEQVVGGMLPDWSAAELTDSLRAVARRTEHVRADDILLSSPAEVIFAGRIAEMTEGYVVLVQAEGATTMVPRWMTRAAQRDRLGAPLALVADKLDGASAVIQAIPGIELEDPTEAGDFSPFERNDARAQSVTGDDVRLLSGEPQPLRVLVPVTIDE